MSKEKPSPREAKAGRHYWQERPLPPSEQAAPAEGKTNQHWELRLLECQRCRLGITVYAKEGKTQHRFPPETKCVTVHLSRAIYTKDEVATEEDTTYPEYYGLCGYHHRWMIGSNQSHSLSPHLDWKFHGDGQLPIYRRVNCPDCRQAVPFPQANGAVLEKEETG